MSLERTDQNEKSCSVFIICKKTGQNNAVSVTVRYNLVKTRVFLISTDEILDPGDQLLVIPDADAVLQRLLVVGGQIPGKNLEDHFRFRLSGLEDGKVPVVIPQPIFVYAGCLWMGNIANRTLRGKILARQRQQDPGNEDCAGDRHGSKPEKFFHKRPAFKRSSWNYLGQNREKYSFPMKTGEFLFAIY